MRSNKLYALSLLVSKIAGRIIRFDKFATRRYNNNKVIMTIIIKSNTFFLDIGKERSSRVNFYQFTVSSSNKKNFTRKLKDKAIIHKSWLLFDRFFFFFNAPT